MITRRTFSALAVATAVCALAGPATAADYPSERLTYTIAFGPGGGNDRMSRTVVDILRKYDLYAGDIVVENREGGSGAVGFSYVSQQAGDPYRLTSTSGNFIGTPLVADTDWTYADFTPIGLLASDAMLLVVRADSDVTDVDAFVEAAKAGRVTIAGSGSAGPERVTAALFAKAAGIEFEYVPIGSGGELVTALTSGSVDAVVANPSEVAGQLDAGTLEALAFSDNARSTNNPDVPTFKELGYDFSFSLPRGVVMPSGLAPEVQDWWIATLKQVIETPEWQEYLVKNGMSGNPIWGAEFAAYLEETSAQYRAVLVEIGAIEG
ncbi:Bug family tripartite tricarboxylate transporter substrate binding protein [Roseobacter sinensis]|uniref:Tripartite tricarboxylate transporter substrate binding protein n=1 Tax=Roseobacter sinensis TaxID=2931391 RepID=A0ABT3BGR4_9RHOB|nr:tripartite tricarboxylate transporter substrate binding protein [Roseobacter sp. WL0113]MCV3272758.1 tripartite tricarboxylate transporter substrate binding protein [Roseobacter sp. WL0113]